MSENTRLQEIANRLLEDLRLPRRVRKIEWSGLPGVDRPVLRHGLLFLGDDLQEKLLPEEWRPIIAAALVDQFQFRKRRVAVGLLFLAAWLSLVGTFFWYYIPSRVPLTSCDGPWCNGDLFVVPVTVTVVMTLLMAPLFRGMKLRADLLAAQEFGIRTELGRVLRKINEILPNPMPESRWLSLTPPISKRLENLAQAESMI